MNARPGNLAGRPPMGLKVPKPERGTAAAKRHIEAVKALACVICGRDGPSDAHHVICGRYGQRKASDFDVILLCKAHHQDGPDAIHNGKESWVAKFGADHDYLAVVADLLAGKLTPMKPR